MRLALWLSVIFAMALGAAPPAGSATAEPQFVGVEGAHFVLHGSRFNVAGINNHYLTYGSRAEVERVLDDAVAMGANVVRTFIQPVIGSLDGKRVRPIWDWRSKASSNDLGWAAPTSFTGMIGQEKWG